MKQVFTSAGIMALSAAALYAYDPEMTRQLSGRPWTVAATVRGFYDDNVTTSPNKFKEDSFGGEISPSAHLNLPMEQTFLSLGYIYSFRWYENREPSTDQSHEFNAKLRHQFSPRHDISVNESFIYTSEPTVAERVGFITAPIRTESDILHNRGSINYNAGLSQRVSLGIGYNNDWYDYEQDGTGSRSALLDRLEHLIHADARYQVNPSVVGLIGYSFRLNTYTGDENLYSTNALAAVTPPLSAAAFNRAQRQMSDYRDNHSHYVYVGVDYDLTARLRGTVRVGGQFTEYTEADESSVSPYADASLTYAFLPRSSVTVGVRHDRNATDIVSPDGKGRPTLDAESTVAYVQLIHQITTKLTGSLIGQYQTSEFNDGASDGSVEDLYLVGANLSYSFNRHFSTEVGYNYDLLDSDVRGRDYHRNRVYVGVRATY